MNTPAIRRTCDIATVFLVVAAVALWVVEPALPTPGVDVTRHPPPAGVRTQPLADPASTGADAGAIVSGNIFSATRAAPPTRYTPPGPGSEAMAEQPIALEFAPPVVPPRVYGIMSGPGGATALIQPDSAGASGRLYREGERVGQFRIEKILGSSVVLRGPSGRMEIKVEQREERIP